MKSMKNKLKAILYVPLASLFLLFGFLPLQSVHAESIAMNHDMSGSRSSASNCCVPSSSVAVINKEEQLFDEQDDEPEPPEQMPFYARFQVFTEPSPPAVVYSGSKVPRPPDLVKLYANFRF